MITVSKKKKEEDFVNDILCSRCLKFVVLN